ncbi:NAD(P)/FAD-dependent oxidoreductase [Bailinhaonella thermotolerans]|uniref:Oxidoreductase n=1 Tax=Bailinhaonella thermotolerans TaxID=1070861 RepID=A0A3A4B590_9ACTN|nr:FAD-dependent oxidoreductase [Bailinhaonella thermotolerans]RJL33241.1 oxidoreductase [Bailinhaonella thermotolerans]
MAENLVVVGAGYAGLAAAKRAAHRLRGTGIRVTLVNASDRFVERVRLHELAAGHTLRDLPLAGLLAGSGVEPVVATVTGLDPESRTVELDAPPYGLPYDVLVYALGSGADLDAVPGVREHAHTLADARGAAAVRDALPGAESVAVVGGGLTGMEAASEIAEAHPHLRVRLVAGGRIAPGLPERARDRLLRGLSRLRVEVYEDTAVREVVPGALLLDGDGELPADVAVWAAGFRVPPLAAESGLATDGDGRIRVDPALRSVSHPEVIGAGDAAAARIAGGTSRMACQTALPMGLFAGEAAAAVLLGREPRPARVRYLWQNISLGRHDGYTQFSRADDSPLPATLTGRASAAFKEAVTRGTVRLLRAPHRYPLPAADRLPATGETPPARAVR